MPRVLLIASAPPVLRGRTAALGGGLRPAAELAPCESGAEIAALVPPLPAPVASGAPS